MSENKTLESLASKLDNRTESLIRENVLLRRFIKSLRIENKALRANKTTPSSKWLANGEKDPHPNRYDGERSKLTMGNLTDDELANGAFINYDAPLNIEGILLGTHHSPIAWMTAVKDRIRWLSRALVKSETERAELLKALTEKDTKQ